MGLPVGRKIMSFDAIGNVAELISSIAVLISLIYLAVQIKKSTETARTSTYHSIVSAFGDMNQTMASVPDLSFLYVRALEEFESLDESEKARISQLFYSTFRYFENMFYQHEKGYLEDDVWVGWERLMVTYFRRSGFQIWWSMRRDVFSKAFVAFLESAESVESIASYYELTQQESAAAIAD
jgi:hypothetical protein